MADLKTTYKDDVLDTTKNTKRRFNMITNSDGTVSFEDVTEYSQVGDSFGAADINATNEAVSALNTNIGKINSDMVTLMNKQIKVGYIYFVQAISYNTDTSIDIAEKVGIDSSRFLAVIPTLVATSTGGIIDRMVSNWESTRYIIKAKTMYSNGEVFYIGVTFFYV